MTPRFAILTFVTFLYFMVWIALALRVVPEAVADLTSDSVYGAVLNIAISGTLLAIPAYTFYRIWMSGRAGRSARA